MLGQPDNTFGSFFRTKALSEKVTSVRHEEACERMAATMTTMLTASNDNSCSQNKLEPILSRVDSPGLDPPISKKQTPYLQKLPRHRADPVPRGLERLEPRETPDGPSGVCGEGGHQRAHALRGRGRKGRKRALKCMAINMDGPRGCL